MLKKISTGLILMIGLLTSVWGIVTAAPTNSPNMMNRFPPGDCNGNGSVTAADIATIRTAIETNDGAADGDCDANSDGVVDAGDLACVPLLLAGETCDAPTPRTLIGTNLDQAVHYTSQYAFADPFKQSSGWFPMDHNFIRLPVDAVLVPPLDLDDNGWPRSLPDCVDNQPDPNANYCYLETVLYGFGGDYPAGQYLVTQEGKGLIGFGGQGVAPDWGAGVCGNCDPGYYTIDIDDSNGLTSISVKVVATGDPNDPTNYLRNIRFYPPTYAPDHPSPNYSDTAGSNFGNLFHDDFIDSLSQYGVVRFMDWMRTNWVAGEPVRSAQSKVERSEWRGAETPEDAQKREISGSLPRNDSAETFTQFMDWADRPLMEDAFYSLSQGVPAEAMIDLVNIVDSAPWFNMPHQASDDYVTGFATLARDTLTTDKPIYIEYSNEIWNDRFSQGYWIELTALSEFPVDPPLTESAQHARYKWYGKRTNEMCAIWKQVFGADSDRIVCVVAGQANNAGINGTGSYRWVMDAFLGCDFQLNCANSEIDAFAIAPYFGQDVGSPDYEDSVENWTTATLFGQLMTEGVLGTDTRNALGQARDNIELYVDAAAVRDVKLIAYEGGQHLVGINETNNNQEITDLFIAANRDPMMGVAYDSYLDNWRAAGGDLFVHFTHMSPYTLSGSWGASEFYDQDTPKSLALDRYATEAYAAPVGLLEFDTATSSGTSTNQIWNVPVLLESVPNNVQAVSFVIAYDDAQFTVDNVTLEQNQGDHTLTMFDDGTGLLSITIASDSATHALVNGNLIQIELTQILATGDGVAFVSGTNGSGSFKPITCGGTLGITVNCIGSTQVILSFNAVTMTPTPAPTSVITATMTPTATVTDAPVTITAPTTVTVTPTSTSSATVQPIVTVEPTMTPTATIMATQTPTSTVTVMPIVTNTPVPTPTSTPVPPPLNTAVRSIGAGKLQYLPWVATAGTALVAGTLVVQRSKVR